VFNRWQGSTDALVRRYFAISDGDIQILANQYTFSGQIKVGHFDYGHYLTPSDRTITF
jgi:hypothetical protein